MDNTEIQDYLHLRYYLGAHNHDLE